MNKLGESMREEQFLSRKESDIYAGRTFIFISTCDVHQNRFMREQFLLIFFIKKNAIVFQNLVLLILLQHYHSYCKNNG